MATATVYTISDGVIVEQFDTDYNFAIGEYHGKRNRNGTYYIAKKGVAIPFPEKNRLLKNVFHQADREQSS
jgi:hypothetical protein